MTVVATNAALAQVTVSQQVYEKDILLQWVCQVASPLQLTVKIVDDKASSATLQLDAQNVVLHQRNTILRALCGIALCNALDQKPFYLLAGGSASPIVIGKMVHWMSVADSLRCSSAADADDATFLVDLEQQLQDSAFLMASSQASLADMDLALVLASQEIDAVYTNVLRWRETVLNTMRLLLQANSDKTVVIPTVSSVSSVTSPIFFNGTEDVSTILQPKKKVTATKKNDSSCTSSQQPSQNKQQQQQKPTDKKQQTKKAKGGEAGGGGGGAVAETAEFSISALDIRVGKIIKAWHHPEAEKLFCEEVDLGTETRQIASGLRAFYQTEDLQDRHVLVLCNLKKRNLVGFPSHGMVLCASNADHTAVEFVVPPPGSKPGERVLFEGHVGEPEPENKVAKKKIFEALAPDLKTDKDGQVVWKGALAKTEAGVVKALNGMSDAHVA